MRNLKLYNSGEYGDVSKISSLVNLTYLLLNDGSSASHFPLSIGQLSKLQYLRWINNRNSGGVIPNGVSKLGLVSSFFVDNSNITGVIPRNFYKMGSKIGKGLRVTLKDNKLHGTIPRISDITKDFECAKNQLSGFTPDAFKHSRRLKSFFADNNRLKGTIPGGFSRNTHLCRFSVRNNCLSGPIPKELTKLNKKYFRWLDLSKNNFSGSVPEAFVNYTGGEDRSNLLVCLNLCGNPLLNLSRLDPASGSPLALALHKELGPGQDENGTLGNAPNAGPICKYGIVGDKETDSGLLCEEGTAKNQQYGTFCNTY
jgi:hypothetical protein